MKTENKTKNIKTYGRPTAAAVSSLFHTGSFWCNGGVQYHSVMVISNNSCERWETNNISTQLMNYLCLTLPTWGTMNLVSCIATDIHNHEHTQCCLQSFPCSIFPKQVIHTKDEKIFIILTHPRHKYIYIYIFFLFKIQIIYV